MGGTEIEEMRDWRKLEGSEDALVLDWGRFERVGAAVVAVRL